MDENDELDEQLRKVQVQLEAKLIRPQKKPEEYQSNQEPLRPQRNGYPIGPISNVVDQNGQRQSGFF